MAWKYGISDVNDARKIKVVTCDDCMTLTYHNRYVSCGYPSSCTKSEIIHFIELDGWSYVDGHRKEKGEKIIPPSRQISKSTKMKSKNASSDVEIYTLTILHPKVSLKIGPIVGTAHDIVSARKKMYKLIKSYTKTGSERVFLYAGNVETGAWSWNLPDDVKLLDIAQWNIKRKKCYVLTQDDSWYTLNSDGNLSVY